MAAKYYAMIAMDADCKPIAVQSWTGVPWHGGELIDVATVDGGEPSAALNTAIGFIRTDMAERQADEMRRMDQSERMAVPVIA